MKSGKKRPQTRRQKTQERRTTARRLHAQRPTVLPGTPVDRAPGADRDESGTDGDPPPSDESGAQGDRRVSPARTVDRVRPPATDTLGPAHPIVRPYRLSVAADAASALEFASWFSSWFSSHWEEALGIAFRDQTLGLANSEEGWQVLLNRHDLVDDAVKNALAAFTSTLHAPRLVFQDAAVTIPALLDALQLDGLDLKDLLKLMVGDLQVLQDCVGRRIERGSFQSPADEAYAAFTAEQHWGAGAPPFYRSVGLPWLSQQIYVASSPPEGVPWRISYSDLFLRVLAHFTREPALVAAFADERDPVTEIAERLELQGEDQTIAITFWAAIGFDAVYLSERHPKVYALLPDGLTDLRQAIERQFSTLCLAIIQQREDYTRGRRLETLYGRWILWGLPLSEALAQRWLGSVQDILDVAETSCAAFWGEEPLPVWPVAEELLGRVIRVRGLAPNDRSRWLPILEGVAQASWPLSVPGAPVVIWGE